MTADRWRRLALFVALVPLARFAADVARGFDHLMFWYLVDDAFYYFEIAKHLPEFNEGIPTTGFHPLYAVAIAPLQLLFSWSWSVPLCLGLLVLAQSLGTPLVYRLVASSWSRPVAFASAAAWATSGRLYAIAMTGVEAVLAATVVVAWLVLWTRTRAASAASAASAPPASPSGPRLVALGLLAGVAFLARMDSALVLAPACLLVLARETGTPRRAVLFVAAGLALPLAWIATMVALTGDWVPTSGAALRVLSAAEDGADVTVAKTLQRLDVFWTGFLAFLDDDPRRLPGGATVAALLLVPVAAAGLARRRGPREADGPDAPRVPVAPLATAGLAGLAAWIAYYVFYQRVARFWYLAHLAPLLYGLYLPCVFAALERLVRPRASATALQLALVVLLAWTSSKDSPTAPQEYDKYHAALEANRWVRTLPDHVRVGAFNAGIYDYFMERDVLNLDGVVNPEALEAHRAGTLARYLVRNDVGVLIEHPTAVGFAQIRPNPNFGIRPWVDLSRTYPPFRGRPVKETFLWTVDVREDRSRRR